MDNLERVLEAFEKNRDVKEVITAGLSLDAASLQAHILQIPEDRRERFLGILGDLSVALTEYIEKTAHELHETKDQIEGTNKSAKACLSYGSTQGLTPKKDDADKENE